MKSLALPILAALLAVTAVGARAEEARNRTITVSGEASVSARPDMALVNAGVFTQAEKAGGALDANSTATAAVIGAIKGLSIEAKDIETSGFSLQPNITYERTTDGSQGKPSITGYSVSNNVTVQVRDLGKLGSLLDKVVEAGANTINGVTFVVTKQSEVRDAARGAAVQDARRKAELIATAAGTKLGKVLAIGEGDDFGARPMLSVRAAAAPMAAVPIEAGEQSLQARVTITYELTD